MELLPPAQVLHGYLNASVPALLRDSFLFQALTAPAPSNYFWVFLAPWAVMFTFSWIGFSMYMYHDYQAYKAKELAQRKLPTRHPLVPFWESQLTMVPCVLWNELVVWPITSLIFIAPHWSRNYNPEWWSEHWYLGLPVAIVCLLVSDFLWYWSHRLLHVRAGPINFWQHYHLNHHLAPQAALSASYISWVEQVLFTVSIQLPWALVGFPILPYLIPVAWGMLTGSGAHSGYGGGFAQGEQHQAHHNFTDCNFGLLMIADEVFGTHWVPGQPAPPASTATKAIIAAHGDDWAYGAGEAHGLDTEYADAKKKQ